MVARDQPNSRSIGSMSAPVEDRKAAAATSAPSVTAATIQAGWKRPPVEVVAQFDHAGHAGVDRLADLSVGDVVADADDPFI